MKSITSLLLVLSLSLSPALAHVAWADPRAVAAPADPSRDADDADDPKRAADDADDPKRAAESFRVAAAANPFLVAAPARYRVHREKVLALALAGSSVGLSLSGGFLISIHNASDPALDTGIALTAIGGSIFFPSLLLGTYSAGHDSGLGQLSRFMAADPERRWALADSVERAARIEQQTGMGLFFSGLGLFAGGLGMVMGGFAGVNFDSGTGGGGNGGLFVSGTCISVLGDAMWLTGMFLWAHGSGKQRGVREAREAISVTPMGISGRF